MLLNTSCFTNTK